jgi:hypothetical protein
MKFFFFLYMGLVVWFFFWLRPRVNDGRIEQIFDKVQILFNHKISTLKQDIKKKGIKHHE